MSHTCRSAARTLADRLVSPPCWTDDEVSLGHQPTCSIGGCAPMTWSSRRALAVLSAAALVAVLSNWLPQVFVQKGLQPGGPPTTQPGQPKKPPVATGDPTDLGGVSLTPDEALKTSLENKIKAAQDNILVENWKEAVEILQQLLDREEDVFVPVTRQIGEEQTATVITSVRGEAARMIGNLPAKGLEFYKLTYGGSAAEKLKLAKESGDATYLDEVMRRFLYTDSGVEAAELLATRALDRGNFAKAAICFELLFQRSSPENLHPQTLFKSALAFHLCNDERNFNTAWDNLKSKASDGLSLAGKNVNLAELKEWVTNRKSVFSQRERNDFVMIGGDPTRSSQG